MRGSKKNRSKTGVATAEGKGDSSENRAVPLEPKASQENSRWRKVLIPALVAIFFALLYACVPRLPLTAEGDDNWATVLTFAHEKGLQYGPGIATNHGPLGFLTIQWFSGTNMGLRLFFDLLMASIVATGICLLVWRMDVAWRCVVLGALILLPAHAFNGGMDILYNFGVMTAGFLCFVETGPRLKYYVTVLVGLAIFCVLAKFTLLATAGATLGFVTCDLWIRKKRLLAAVAPVSFVVAFLLLWLLLGQKLGNLPDYVVNLLAISSGYNDSLAEPPPPAVGNGGMLVAVLILATILVRCFAKDDSADKTQRWRRGLLGLWVLSQIFVEWKHGYTRSGQGDAHVLLFLVVAPVIALLVDVVPLNAARLRLVTRISGIAACVAALIVCQLAFKGILAERLEFVIRRVPGNLSTFLYPAGYLRKMEAENKVARERVQLPKLRKLIGNATVDVFGWHQAIAIFNDLNYHPRPIFQNFQAYHPTLINVNDRFYYTTNAPEFVMFTFDQIDNRFPAIADSRLLVTLLANYQPVGADGGFLLLKRKPVVTPPRMSLITEGDTKIGEPIDLRVYGEADLWLEIKVSPSLSGKLQEFLFRTKYPQLAVWAGPNPVRAAEFRAPKMMLATGFLASPLQLGTDDVLRLCMNAPLRRAGAYSIEVSSAEKKYWRDSVHYKIYRIEPQLGRDTPRENLRAFEQ